MARRARSFTRGPRRAVDWSASGVLTTGVTVAAGVALLLESFTPIVGGETLIRTRGVLAFWSDQSATNETQIGAFGIAVVTQQAVSVGITAIPHPGTDAAWGGWVYHTYLHARFQIGSAVGFQGNFATQIEIDSKGMRKVDEDERLVVVVENMNPSHGFVIANSERFLSKVH